MTVIINSNTGGELNAGGDGTGSPVATANALARTSYLSTNLGDALSAQVSYGWDQVSGSARVVFPTPVGSLNATLSVSLGAGNNVQRFGGPIRQLDTAAFPHAVTLMAKGPLSILEEYLNDVQSTDGTFGKPGLALVDLIGSFSATLQQIVAAVLDRCGVSYSLSNFDNPSNVYGLLGTNDALMWGSHETASAYLHRFLEASEGYRLFDSSDSGVYLKQISAIPNDSPGTPGSGDFTFTLGDDIFADSTSSTSNIQQQTAVLVEGLDFFGLRPATSGVIGSGTSAFHVSSPLIETDSFASDIATFWLPLVNRPQRLVRLSTPRDELIGPGATLTINGLGTNETMWVRSVTTEVTDNGAFSQNFVCVAGAS